MSSVAKTNAHSDQDREVIRKREIFKSIKESFGLFDRDNKGVCDVREIGTIVRHLGICPTEIELHDMITEVSRRTCARLHLLAPACAIPTFLLQQIEDEEPNGFIRYERFERMMSRVLIETQYPRDSEDKLLRAFR
ncbi:MAG: hypothetical protein SGPRY_006604, partial [Prymnesium sp.]